MCFIKKDPRPALLLKKETPAYAFSCELSIVFKNTFYTENFAENVFVLWWPIAAN